MRNLPKGTERAVANLQRLPSIGPKSAMRLAYFLMQSPKEYVEELADSLVALRRGIQSCQVCHNLTDDSVCEVCQQQDREVGVLCVVGYPKDVVAIEKTREFKGIYHVLGGLINPLEGIGPERITVGSLVERVDQGEIKEMILAIDPTVAGEATSIYLHRQFKDKVRVTRLAQGIQSGTDLEYADEVTLGRALRNRQEF